MRLRRPLVSMLAVSALTLAIAAPATADLKPPPPLPDDPDTSFFYNLWFGPTPTGWSPEGTVTSDAGFRSFPNGFPYANYGGMMDITAAFFDTPAGPMIPLTSVQMRSLYGDRVCTSSKGLAPGAPCTLTPTAAYWSEYLFDSAQGGVCFGMAATAGAIFNGDTSPTTVGAGTLTFQSQLTPDTQLEILRNFSAQYTLFNVPGQSLTPVQVVEELQASIQEGEIPYVLTLRGEVDGKPEGHAITPYAVYDRGNGLIDIAVYDNNYPTRARAVHVDTVANTWVYLMQTTPSGSQALISGDGVTKSLGLVATADILAEQQCPFCAGSPVDLVTFDPLPADAGVLDPTLLTLDDSPLAPARYGILPPLTPPSTDYTTMPAVEVIRDDGYKLGLDGGGLTAAAPVSINNVSAKGGKFATIPSLPAGASAVVTYRPDDFSVRASAAVTMDLTRSFSVSDRHYGVSGVRGKALAADNGRRLVHDRSARQILLTDLKSAGGSMVVTAELVIGSKSSEYTSKSVKYPAGGQLVLVYKEWKKVKQAPQLWLDRDSDGTLDKRLPMSKVSS